MTINTINSNNILNKIAINQQTNHLPTKEQALAVFKKLGDKFWMQFMDARFTDAHGPLVFDNGLHDPNSKEPGFYASLVSGFNFAAEHLTEPPSSSFYKELHQHLCAHFKGEENNTLIHAKQAGKYRNDYPGYEVDISKRTNEAKAHYIRVNSYQIMEEIKKFQEETKKWEAMLEQFTLTERDNQSNNSKATSTQSSKPKEEEAQLEKEATKSKAWITQWEAEWRQKVVRLQIYIDIISGELSIQPLCQLRLQGHTITFSYTSKPEELEKIVEDLFNRYNEKIVFINTKAKYFNTDQQIQKLQRERISAIAELFQLLEWLHPFGDGQGRTDVVLLGKLLTEQGLNPSILDDPYFSSHHPLEEWEDYLLAGIERWKTESAKI